ncbi:hypothetical protein VNO80_13832 [Phaseolus coccineus]|uniref:Uncharacterized protein n=1 Tax=Phaseolus coccineus TaxID=3886 RepID=A0AAN9N2E2_PHACN
MKSFPQTKRTLSPLSQTSPPFSAQFPAIYRTFDAISGHCRYLRHFRSHALSHRFSLLASPIIVDFFTYLRPNRVSVPDSQSLGSNFVSLIPFL